MDILNAFMELLFPPRCPSCHSYVQHEGDWCTPCLQKETNVHLVALPPDSVFDKVWALANYHGTMRSLIINLKYNGKKNTLHSIHKYIDTVSLSLSLPADIDNIICVPLHKKRLRQRGFNQTELIFKKWLNTQNHHFEEYLKRTHFTERQHKLNRNERFRNIQGAFSLKENFTAQGKSFLLLDDIYTTGATLESCAAVLRNNGATTIYGLVLASDA